MTQDFADMLYLLGSNYKSQIKDVEHNYNVSKIKQLSDSQGIWTLVFTELEKYKELSEYADEFMQSVAVGIQSNLFQLQTIVDLNKAGYRACLLKGAAVAVVYPESSLRISSDTDILIEPENEQDIIEFLRLRGYTVSPREKNDHHFKAYHPVGGLLEGHVRLYSIPTEKILLDGLKLYDEDWTEEKIEGFNVPILGLNDGLMYLTAHYIKHFVNEGGGVRQMLDLLLYIEHYKDKLNLERYNTILKQLRYDKLIDVVKTIGAKYWGFNYSVKYEKLADEILTDSECGGIFGFDTNERQGFYKAYCEKRSDSALKSKTMMIVKNERGLKNLLFPPQRILLTKKEYQYAKNKLLIPVAWMHRLCINILKRLNKNRQKESNGVEKRMDLMRELDMIG